ncbi:YebC/PmpR family DNA-binding transcriptional regulator [Sinanaerobacter chloroacetimidivorans]|jgi:YebC/PmpR family DNA-binding regulatory protein|uniref:Probable transcriptional regulatory protein KCX82_02450 n=1 Tax=Sinanaerobacter chloroacetimidivorans TaxID=2818044 RepID=A0A8J7VXA0_9FIRM|nr:YebC/PmpR family DNA-binding transcriptional regulator [Sinanaerobacter chloroacetimidivorans]MBR0596727.1 YebC/PmpR family DNA-binding transcriptional regulator [Sinanaerobacter chloroacetimidivorans]
MGRHGTIANRKASQDSKRAQVFTKYARAITVAAKSGGDPDYNMSLKHAIDKAKGINMPNDNITRAIKKGTGELAGETYESGSFEGYGAGGVAVIVDVLTDNRNRTTAAMKHAFDKFGGNLGVPGCVSYMFERKGIIIIEKTNGIEEDALMEAALENGAEDMITHEDSFEVQTTPDTFNDVSEALKAAGYEFVEADIEYVPSMESAPTDEHDIKNLKKMIDMLEDNDDVQKVYHNCSLDLDE